MAEYSEVITFTTTASAAGNHIDLAAAAKLGKNCTSLLLINEDTVNYVTYQTRNKTADAGATGDAILRAGESILLSVNTSGFSAVANTSNVNVRYVARA